MIKRMLALPLAGTMLLLAGCAGTPEDAPESLGLDEVTVGVIPIVDVAPIYLGIEQGFFEENGIQLKPELAQGGAALLPAVVSGDYQFGFSNVVSLMLASDQGLPIKFVAPGVSSTGTPGKDYGGVLVAEDSTISSMADLPGKTVATNSTLNINGMLIRDAVDNAGGDSSKINFVEMPYLDMIAALSKGDVDAIFEPEPFFTMAKDQGNRDLYSLYAEATENLEVSAYFTTQEFAASNADLVDRFNDALKKSFTYATDNPDEARDIVGTYTKIDPTIISKLTLPAWPSDSNEKSLKFLAELCDRYGLTDGAVDINSLLQG